MLTTDGGLLGLAALVAVLFVTAVISLFVRPVLGSAERMKPFSLSDKDRVVLQAAVLDIRRRAQQERKARRRTERTDGEPAARRSD